MICSTVSKFEFQALLNKTHHKKFKLLHAKVRQVAKY